MIVLGYNRLECGIILFGNTLTMNNVYEHFLLKTTLISLTNVGCLLYVCRISILKAKIDTQNYKEDDL